MFKNSSVFVLLKDDHVRKLELTKNVQEEICSLLSQSTNVFLEKDEIEFNGSYKPNDDECLYIHDFQLSDEIKDALRNPIGVLSFTPIKDDDVTNIKAVFVGDYYEKNGKEIFTSAFQRFRKEQHIQPLWFNLFYSKGTFSHEKRKGISITDIVDCVFDEEKLKFSSFYYARQIFSLNEYYRVATDIEVVKFTNHDKLLVENMENFKQCTDTWVRRKIAMINDSGVLQDNSVERIQNSAKQINIQIEIREGKLVLPADKERLKHMLGFLDEEAYRGPFSQNTYLANSKRQI